jgi:hypothetical protein
MSSTHIAELIIHIPMYPTPLFCDDVDSTNSHDDNKTAIKKMMATQDPNGSGEVDKLTPSFSLLDLLSCMDMWEPWMEGPRSEK